jgi:translation initiation factor IF-3
MINERVAYKFRDVRVIGADGSQVGILQSRQALNMAREAGLDLVMVSATAQPPVVRIVDYGRFKYETEKREKDHKRKQQEIKGIKISPRIAEHDLSFLTKNATRFLEEGHKVKVTCMFKAREVTHPELGRQKLDKVAEAVSAVAVVERPPAMEGRLMIMILNPKPQAPGKKNAKAEDKQDGGQAVQDNGDREDNPPKDA